MSIATADRILVFGGPYSNFQATAAMRREADRMGIPAEHVVCTGDVVAYGADPEDTVELVRDWGIHVVAGNCEEQLAQGAEDCGCGFTEGSVCDVLSRGWYPYAQRKISEASRAWMAQLPSRITFSFSGRRWTVIHGGTQETSKFVFGSQTELLESEARAIDTDVVLAGHCGLPFLAEVGEKSWVNAGVIGVPANDGTTDGWFALCERSGDDVTVSLRRLTYDHDTAAARMRKAGHANGYARALTSGIWPSHDVLPPSELNATGRALSERKATLARHHVAAADLA